MTKKTPVTIQDILKDFAIMLFMPCFFAGLTLLQFNHLPNQMQNALWVFMLFFLPSMLGFMIADWSCEKGRSL